MIKTGNIRAQLQQLTFPTCLRSKTGELRNFWDRSCNFCAFLVSEWILNLSHILKENIVIRLPPETPSIKILSTVDLQWI